jgi:hypothetical protein
MLERSRETFEHDTQQRAQAEADRKFAERDETIQHLRRELLVLESQVANTWNVGKVYRVISNPAGQIESLIVQSRKPSMHGAADETR